MNLSSLIIHETDSVIKLFWKWKYNQKKFFLSKDWVLRIPFEIKLDKLKS